MAGGYDASVGSLTARKGGGFHKRSRSRGETAKKETGWTGIFELNEGGRSSLLGRSEGEGDSFIFKLEQRLSPRMRETADGQKCIERKGRKCQLART